MPVSGPGGGPGGDRATPGFLNLPNAVYLEPHSSISVASQRFTWSSGFNLSQPLLTFLGIIFAFQPRSPHRPARKPTATNQEPPSGQKAGFLERSVARQESDNIE
eukprot:CAMPEP_0174893212 /NCGR_PEP_ID=MMETSP0167-20121228/8054_1 /TAXON_ID=38298 /ORGANISM="Rhodella maculata, Strain CCMP736" /LENGTH=104 /DNA_ID=CAMNT_0016131941 /DNA_START=71 /DNA_END=385 /DNA_ORIENTATION=-